MLEIEQRLLTLLARRGSILGAATVGEELYPEATMQPHGAAFAASRVLRMALDHEFIARTQEGKRWRYEITNAGREALSKAKEDARRQGSLL